MTTLHPSFPASPFCWSTFLLVEKLVHNAVGRRNLSLSFKIWTERGQIHEKLPTLRAKVYWELCYSIWYSNPGSRCNCRHHFRNTIARTRKAMLPSRVFTASEGKMADLWFEVSLLYIISSPDIIKFELQNLVYVKWMVPNKIVSATEALVEFHWAELQAWEYWATRAMPSLQCSLASYRLSQLR